MSFFQNCCGSQKRAKTRACGRQRRKNDLEEDATAQEGGGLTWRLEKGNAWEVWRHGHWVHLWRLCAVAYGWEIAAPQWWDNHGWHFKKESKKERITRGLCCYQSPIVKFTQSLLLTGKNSQMVEDTGGQTMPSSLFRSLWDITLNVKCGKGKG